MIRTPFRVCSKIHLFGMLLLLSNCTSKTAKDPDLTAGSREIPVNIEYISVVGSDRSTSDILHKLYKHEAKILFSIDSTEGVNIPDFSEAHYGKYHLLFFNKMDMDKLYKGRKLLEAIIFDTVRQSFETFKQDMTAVLSIKSIKVDSFEYVLRIDSIVNREVRDNMYLFYD